MKSSQIKENDLEILFILVGLMVIIFATALDIYSYSVLNLFMIVVILLYIYAFRYLVKY